MSEPATKMARTDGTNGTNGDAAAQKFLLFGGTGWLGGMLIAMLTEQGKDFVVSKVRLQNRESLEAELDREQPTHVLCAAGVTGRPNVDWCEDHKEETIRTNVIGALNCADCCSSRGIHMTLYATGCIFEYDDKRPMPTLQADGTWSEERTFEEDNEEDTPNFADSFYSFTKGHLEQMLRHIPNVLILRVRMPISDDLSPRNFITKICKYRRVVDIPNSMTVLTDLMPVSVTMAERGLTGVYNFCNPGPISHHQILDLYKQYIDPEFEYEGFSLEEQAKVIKAGRSNNTLSHTKLVEALPDVNIPPMLESIHGVFQRMKVNLEKEGIWPDNLPRQKI
uniref:RmlD-like substrate binding domain-containing protein n=1 Tax=Phaeomonas parva TaxID=124430 RepID=A0A6U4K2R2_9STRA|mmetsp:Transcript_45931/g.143730  ORF Transcript_45931/g.143730 Transcript_45931/m.143730 type:complete len:337 (+) Transcript_45931:658-1668(+)